MKTLLLTLLLFAKIYPHDLLKFRNGKKLEVNIVNIDDKYLVFQKLDDTTSFRLPLVQLKYFRYAKPTWYRNFSTPSQKIYIKLKYYRYDLRQARKAQRKEEMNSV